MEPARDVDLPEFWYSILKAEDEFAVQGAVRVLKELSRDLTDSQVEIYHNPLLKLCWEPCECTQVPSIAPVILPDIYRIFCESERFTVRTRARAVEIFTTPTSMICTMGEVTMSKPMPYLKWQPGLAGEQVAAEVFVEPSLVNILWGASCLPWCPRFTNLWCWPENRGSWKIFRICW